MRRDKRNQEIGEARVIIYSVHSLMQSMHISINEALYYLDFSKEDYNQAKDILEEIEEDYDNYIKEETPAFQIDYHGLFQYANSQNKTVSKLSDKEKERFITGCTMTEIKKERK